MTPTDWQTRIGDVWAAEWRRTDRSFTDLSPALVAIAQERVPHARFHVTDAAHDPVPVRPDLIVSRHGVMFFADPVAAFRRLCDLARPGAALVFSCFRDRAHNPWAGDLVAEVTGIAPAPAAGYAPGPFGFADPALVADILARAGWSAAAPDPVDFEYIAGEGDDAIADAVSYFTRIGPLASTLAAADPADRARLVDRLAAALKHRHAGSCVQFPASAWVWRAKAGKPA